MMMMMMMMMMISTWSLTKSTNISTTPWEFISWDHFLLGRSFGNNNKHRNAFFLVFFFFFDELALRGRGLGPKHNALCARIIKNLDVSTGSPARPFTCSLAPLTHSLEPHYSLARALHCAHSFARSLTSLTPPLVGKWMIRWLFFCFFFYSGP